MKVFVVAPVATQDYCEHVNERFYVGAASHKALGLAVSLFAVGVESALISCPITTQVKRKVFGGFESFSRGVRVLYLTSIGWRGLNRIWASVVYLKYFINNFKSTDRVVFYNAFLEYIPSALFICIRFGRQVQFVDVEDAPPNDEPGIRGFVARSSLKMLRILVSRRLIVASRTIANCLMAEDCCPINGVLQSDIDTSKKYGGVSTLRVLMGGGLSRDTGLDLFFDSVRQFALKYSDFLCSIEFVVTGYGEPDKLKDFFVEANQLGVSIQLLQGLSLNNYRDVLASCHVGLSLKLPTGSLGDSTFPSKVIEYASAGLLVVTTRVSDIEAVFDSSNSVMLKDNNGCELADVYAELLNNPDLISRMASQGQEKIFLDFSASAVGERLRNFIN